MFRFKLITFAWSIILGLVGLLLLGLFLRSLNNYTPISTLTPTPPIASSSASPSLTTDSRLLTNTFLITHVTDGDTFDLETGETVRMIGIDTPETVDPHRPKGCFGKEASDKSKEVLTNQRVRLEKDVTDKDKYGRLLRYVFIPTEASTSAIFYNDYLVKEGYAKSYPYPPDTKYQNLFNQSQAEAKLNKRGMWGKC